MLTKEIEMLEKAGYKEFPMVSNVVPPPPGLQNRVRYTNGPRTVILDVFANTATLQTAISNLPALLASPSQEQALISELEAQNRAMRMQLIGMPSWYCCKCGGYSDGSGQGGCPHCGERHYRTGSFVWPADTPQARQWLEKHTEAFDKWLRAAQQQGAAQQSGGDVR